MKKEFTETDVRFAYIQGFNRGVDGNPNQMESYIASLTKTPDVEISDDEIYKASIDYDNGATYETPIGHFIAACKWYREQLKQRQ